MGDLIGGISKNGIVYYKDTNIFELNGWFVPRKSYDSIEVYYNNEFLGSAELDIERKDVVRNFLQFKDDKPGFRFLSDKIKYDNRDNIILLLIKHNGKIVDFRIENMQVIGYENKLLTLYKRYTSADIDFSEIYNNKKCYLLTDENSNVDILKECISTDEVSLITEKSLDKLSTENSFIIVASCKWDTDCRKLEKHGYTAFEDFMPIWYIPVIKAHYVEIKYLDTVSVDIEEYIKFIYTNKKMMAVYGNCQAEKIARGLVCSGLINKEYICFILPGIHEIVEAEIKLLRKILRYLDLFIYQNIKINNKYSPLLSTEYILTALKKECKRICIPNMFFSGYYPQLCFSNKYNKSGLFADGDSNINSLYEKNQLTKSNIDRLNDENYYSKEQVLNFLAQSFEELKKRENEHCDIIISDYLENNYKKSLLFYVSNHPCKVVIIEMVQRIIEFLYGERDENYQWNDDIAELDTITLPIYSSVEKHLNLEFSRKTFMPYKNHSPEVMDWNKYANTYIEKCFGIKELPQT